MNIYIYIIFIQPSLENIICHIYITNIKRILEYPAQMCHSTQKSNSTENISKKNVGGNKLYYV